MNLMYKVKLLTVPTLGTGTVGLIATIACAGILESSPPPARFNSMRELRGACERASIPALLHGMPAPYVVYDLTREQLAALGFELSS